MTIRTVGRVAAQILRNLPAALGWAILMFIMIALGGSQQEWE